MKILDCTLRDGGYYTNWDFDRHLVDTYVETLTHLPIDYLEIGYRSKPLPGYYGEYFYCPVYIMQQVKEKTNKKIAIMLNEKDIATSNITELLDPAKGLVDMVRLAVDPVNFSRALQLAALIKSMGFEVGFNVMYMSKWSDQKEFLAQLTNIDENIDYFNMVDSYGGVYPEDIRQIFNLVRSKTSVKIGFHGHNNMELALINTMTAIECGVDIVDATITGMGRGAGNLKTELLLTALNAKNKLDFDFNILSKAVDAFSKMQEKYGWGTNLPYMVSGANSLPQKEVMEWVGKRFYSFNSIIRALTNQSRGVKDNQNLADFKSANPIARAIIVGGGPTGTVHSYAVSEYLEKNKDISIIHASSKNVKAYANLANKQIHCLAGNEGHRLESTFKDITDSDRIAILPPFPRMMGTYVPSFFNERAYQLPTITFTNTAHESVTAVAIQTALDLGVRELQFIGYDGYEGLVSRNEMELFNENEILFSKLKEIKVSFYSLTPTRYKELPNNSIYSFL